MSNTPFEQKGPAIKFIAIKLEISPDVVKEDAPAPKEARMGFWDFLYDWYENDRGDRLKGPIFYQKYINAFRNCTYTQRVKLAPLALGRTL